MQPLPGEDRSGGLRYQCSACGDEAHLHDVVDFNKSCEELNGRRLPVLGEPIYYARCNKCGLTFAPEMCAWSLDKFAERVYNDSYVDVDPEYVIDRPKRNASQLLPLLPEGGGGIRHLDFGGGMGLLADILCVEGWDSTSYDPFVNRDLDLRALGTFDLITAFEVFEHVPDVGALAAKLAYLLKDDGVVLFTTLLSDGQLLPGERITWWYASPRNGHISLFTRDALFYAAHRVGLDFGSFSETTHVYWRGNPGWATFLPRG